MSTYCQCDVFACDRKQGDEIFVKLPPPEPQKFDISGIPGLDIGGYGGHGGYAARAAPVNMNNFYNAGGGCIAENCCVSMGDCTVKLVQNIEAGDVIRCGSGDNSYNNQTAEVLCVIKIKCLNNEMHLSKLGNGLRITSWHPVKWNNKWIFPNDIDCGKVEKCDFVYNFVLKKNSPSHSMIINGIECVTLGHEMNNDQVLKHEYFATNKVIDDLKRLQGWKNGKVLLNSNHFKRNENTNRVIGIVV